MWRQGKKRRFSTDFFNQYKFLSTSFDDDKCFLFRNTSFFSCRHFFFILNIWARLESSYPKLPTEPNLQITLFYSIEKRRKWGNMVTLLRCSVYYLFIYIHILLLIFLSQDRSLLWSSFIHSFFFVFFLFIHATTS